MPLQNITFQNVEKRMAWQIVKTHFDTEIPVTYDWKESPK